MPKIFLFAAVLLLPLMLRAQDPPAEAPKQLTETERMVRDGMAEALEAKLGSSRSPEDLHAVAQAYYNKSRKARKPEDRKKAFQDSEERYKKWIAALEGSRSGNADKRAVDLAAARVEYGGKLLGDCAERDLAEFEITSGQGVDRKRVLEQLKRARELYEKGLEAIQPLVEQKQQRADDFMAQGIYETLQTLPLDITMSLGWIYLYTGIVEPKDAKIRADSLAAAQKKFQELIDQGQTGPAMYQCHLGLAMALRERGRLEQEQKRDDEAKRRFEEAEKEFVQAMQEGVPVGVGIQARYELARCQVMAGKGEEARTTLKPLLDKDVKNLPPEEREGVFYINLAALVDANSYLVEADALRRSAKGSVSEKSILSRAQRLRETGLGKMGRLASRGGRWAEAVQHAVSMSIDLGADPKSLSPTELLFLGGQLTAAKKYKEAIDRLQEAASRKDLDKDLAGQILFELGTNQYQLNDLRAAAETFQKLALEYKAHDKAPQAAGFAFQLWVKVAEQSKKKEDYSKLADTLLNLLQSFPQHDKRLEAMWGLPVALEKAGRYAEAAEQFGKVPPDSAHGEEAKLRRLVNQRLALETGRASPPAADYADKAKQIAAELGRFSGEALGRAGASKDAKLLQSLSADALIHAAELSAAQGVEQYQAALDLLANFEKKYAATELMGRVLAARIRGYRGLRQFDNASKALEQYLQTVPPDKAGSVLSSLARGMQEEVERLQEEGQGDAARTLANEAITTFQQLEKWFLADEKRAKGVDIVSFGLAQMYHVAGQTDKANEVLAKVLAKDPKNGDYQRLKAMILTADLGADASAERIKAAQGAWAELLKDPAIKTRAPQRYWEARYNWLALLFKQGNAADVEKAIRQERVWYPDLGGAPWNEKLEALYKQAADKLGIKPETQPASQPAGAPTEAAAP